MNHKCFRGTYQLCETSCKSIRNERHDWVTREYRVASLLCFIVIIREEDGRGERGQRHEKNVFSEVILGFAIIHIATALGRGIHIIVG